MIAEEQVSLNVFKLGHLNFKVFESQTKEESSYWNAAIELDPSLKNFEWPDKSPKAELKSFTLQADKRRDDYKIPDLKTRIEKIDQLSRLYLPFNLSYHDFSFPNISKLVRSFVSRGLVKGDASPGLPYSMQYKTNKLFLDSCLELAVYLVYSRIQLRLAYNGDEDPIKLIEMGLCDPVKMFIKNEPHKINKVKEGRLRLIMSVSIIDKLVEMVLYKDLKDLEIANWKRIPSKPGMGFSEDDTSYIYNDVISMDNPMSADVGGYDWSLYTWMHVDDAECMIRLCKNPFPEWEKCVRYTTLIMCNMVYVLSDGNIYICKIKGFRNSGCLITSMSNSRVRVNMALHIGCNRIIAMGDDSVESFVDNAAQKYKELGLELKEYTPVSNEFEFCSKTYTKRGAFPVSYGKTLMRFLHQKPKNFEDYLCYKIGFEDEMRFHPDFPRIQSLIKEVGFVFESGEQIYCE